MEVQVIDDDLEYNKQFDKFLKENGLLQRGNDYHTVAVIGAQSSGKSTLLNLLFDTEFETLDSQRGRMQTTKGIWMARNPSGSVLVFDIEGTDSKERGEQRMTFEQTTSLFALAIADVLLINMWTQDVGRYGASNYGLLKVIFEVNLKLFGQSSAKKLLFVLRDFDDRGNNFERITNIINTDVTNIWNDIYKPEQFRGSKPSDFFHFEFSMIPHKIYEEEKFFEKCKQLRGRFDLTVEDTLFPTSAEGKNVPMDGLALFINHTWDKIRNQKELNLPDQRVMVANLRCTELKDEALALVLPRAQAFKSETERKVISDFEIRCSAILKEALSHYDEFAHQYDKKVYDKARKEVIQIILTQQLYLCFENQLKLIRAEAYQLFEDHALKRPSHSKEQVNENFFKQTTEAYDKALTKFTKQAALLVLEGSGWGEQVSAHESELALQLRALIRNAREKELDKLQMLTQQTAKDIIEQIINGPIYELNSDFWEEIRVPYTKELHELSTSCEYTLKRGFNCDEIEVSEFMQILEQALHQFTVDYIRRLFRDINTNLLRKFNKLFKKDESGKNREWRDIEEGQIRDLWSKCREQMKAVINDFKYIRLNKRALTEAFESSKLDITAGGDDNDLLSSYTKRMPLTKSLSNQYERLLTEEDLNRVKDKFQEDTDFVLEEAIRKHHNVQATSVPWWIYLLLAFFAADNVLSWISSPFIFYPLMMVLSVIAMLYSMGLGGIMFPLFRQSVNLVLRRFGVDFVI